MRKVRLSWQNCSKYPPFGTIQGLTKRWSNPSIFLVHGLTMQVGWGVSTMRRLIRFLHGGPSFIRDIQDLDQVGIGWAWAEVIDHLVPWYHLVFYVFCKPSPNIFVKPWLQNHAECHTLCAACSLWKHANYTRQIARGSCNLVNIQMTSPLYECRSHRCFRRFIAQTSLGCQCC